MEYERVSVIILTYKNINKLKETLKSVYMQDYPNMELIISDDCTPNIFENDIKNIVKNFCSDNIKKTSIYRNNKNIGTVKNINSALRRATGKYIFFIGASDTFTESSVISNVVDYFKKNKCMICVTKRIVHNSKCNSYQIKPTDEDVEILKKGDPKNTFVYLSLTHFMGIGTYFSREIYEKYGYYDENYNLIEDLPFYLHLLEQGGKLDFFDYITINYMPGGVTSDKFQFDSQLNQDRIKIYNDIILPKLHYFNFREKRKLKFDHIFECYRNSKRKLFCTCIQYPDVFFSKVYLKFIRIVRGIL